MDEITSIGYAIAERRADYSWTQEALAERAGVSVDMISRMERGARTGSVKTLMQIARALDCGIGDLVGKRPRVADSNSSVLDVRDAVYDPALLLNTTPDAPPQHPDELMRTVQRGYGAYFSGEFAALAALVPELLRGCRAAEHEYGTAAVAAPYAHAYDLASALLVHTGRDDAALHGVDTAIRTARKGDDEFRPVSFMGTYAWVLLHMGRYNEAERLVIKASDDIAPRMSDDDVPRLAAWGGLMMQAAVVAGTDKRGKDAEKYLAAAESAAVRLGREERRYWITFGPTQVAVQASHIHTTLEQPGKALKAAAKVRRDDLLKIQYGRHLIDKAQSQAMRRRTDEAIETISDAHQVSAEWFRHQRVAESLAHDLRRRKARPPETLATVLSEFRSN